ncbi:uncharacterized protein C8A04DRAFT_9867 [Dichotomopilus funicola]|uniref:Uncharacterized protein n=1 Tax=Dichotomopilus funicola TaxID=1934379 RepID=A0AAN6V946_9PEZI|nr:hypothetical protein C8A04DRAFT_9867 [Dichotomopilus funicola]
MSQQSQQSQVGFPAADNFEMEDTITEDAPATQTTTSSRAAASSGGRGRGRGRWPRGGKGNRVTKAAPPKAATGRGRRQKVYDEPKVQAAYERTQELKQAFLTLSKAVKPVLLELADRSVNEMIQNPNFHKDLPEHQIISNFLRKRHQETHRLNNLQLEQNLAMIDKVYESQVQKVWDEYNTKAAEMCSDAYGVLLRKLDILDYLHDNNLPADDISAEDAAQQGPYVEMEDGVEVPHSRKTVSQLMTKVQPLPLDPKRKADGQPEGQPAAKAAAIAGADGSAPQMPKHPAGLLGAADAIESAVTTPDSGSNAPTPAAEPIDAADAAEEPTLGRLNKLAASTPSDGPDLPSPRWATDADEYGVRLIDRRTTRPDGANNRIMAPNLFPWDELDIGFRDSTNCARKGATKQRRGKYINQPGSNYLFLDRRVGTWDATRAEGELDEELVKKHNLHPRFGIALPGSANESEPPRPMAEGFKPVVFVAPSGEEIHSSRSVAGAKLDVDVDAIERRMEVSDMLGTVLDQETIPHDAVAPDAEELEKNRAEVLLSRGLDPAKYANPAAVPEGLEEDIGLSEAEIAGFNRFAREALGAAETIAAEEEAAARAATTQQRAQPSRPYDAIRDVFTESPSVPVRPPSPPTVAAQTAAAVPIPSSSAASAPLPTALSCLADVALEPVSPAVQQQPVEAPQYEQPPAEYRAFEYSQPQQPHQPLHSHQSHQSQQQQAQQSHHPQQQPVQQTQQQQVQPQQQQQPPRTNDFLRTALNEQPAPSPTSHMPPAQEYGVPLAPAQAPPPPPPQQQQAPANRTPFSSAGAAGGALPALRPMRSLLNEAPPYSEPSHHQMVPSNASSYYPPAANRPYYNSYSMHEQAQPMQHIPAMQSLQPMQSTTMQPMMAQSPMSGGHIQQQTPHRQMGTPPAYHQQPVGHGPGPSHPGQGTLHFQHQQGPPPPPLAPAGMATNRSRPGSSSAPTANAANAAAAASKYRKLEPAPTPPHRTPYGGNGQELRTVQFDYREAIKDYSAVEAPPRHGPTQIRGWTHNNIRKQPSSRPTPPPSKIEAHHPSAGTAAAGGVHPSEEPSA